MPRAIQRYRPVAQQPRALRWLRLFWLRLRLRWVEDDSAITKPTTPRRTRYSLRCGVPVRKHTESKSC